MKKPLTIDRHSGHISDASGAPVGSYRWGKVTATYDARGVHGFVAISCT